MGKRKQIILFIVEGVSEEEALGLGLSRIFVDKEVRIEVTYGDVTTSPGSNSGNIKAKVGNIVRKFAGQTYKPKDFLKVIHVMDTDGAYLSDQYIFSNSKRAKTYYTENGIETADKESICKRNHNKALLMNILWSMHTVWRTIPYEAYYMSSNLDHVLYDTPNLSDDEKYKKAEWFCRQYAEVPQKFLDFFQQNDFAILGDYNKTWKFIARDMNSVRRYSNFGVFLHNMTHHTV